VPPDAEYVAWPGDPACRGQEAERRADCVMPIGAAPNAAAAHHPDGGGVTVHRSVEILIGRLITDEAFRNAFQRNPGEALAAARVWGLELTAAEMNAVLDTDRLLWDRVATELDSRLQKASLQPARDPDTAS
jgi:hypothetical protein